MCIYTYVYVYIYVNVGRSVGRSSRVGSVDVLPHSFCTLGRGFSLRLFISWASSSTCLAFLFFAARGRRYSANIRACCAYSTLTTMILVI